MRARLGSRGSNAHVPDGVRKRVVQAQRREHRAGSREERERVAHEGADDEQDDDEEVVDPIVIRCAARAARRETRNNGTRTRRSEARERGSAHMSRAACRAQRCEQHAPLHLRRDVHLVVVFGGVKRVKNSAGRRSARGQTRERAAKHPGRRAAHAPAGGRGFWFQSTCARAVRWRRGSASQEAAHGDGHAYVQTTRSDEGRASRSATVSSCRLTLPQSMARAQSRRRAASWRPRCLRSAHNRHTTAPASG